MPEPLRRMNMEGTLYERPREIETCIANLEKIEPRERARLFATSSKKSLEYVPSEVLVYFLRRAWADEQSESFEGLFRILMKRVDASLCSAIADSRMAGARATREEILGRFAERIAKDCRSRNGLLDFFEIRFDKALVAFRTSALRQIGPSAAETVPISIAHDDGLQIAPEVEIAAADFLGGDPQQVDDPAFRLAWSAAIDLLPDDQRHVIALLEQGFPIDSKDPEVLTIARLLQCDERTVRNRRDRAFKVLRTVLHEEINNDI